jgi:hypothetical protein
MSTQYRLVQSGKTASGGFSAGPSFVRACSATDFIYLFYFRSLFYTEQGGIPQCLICLQVTGASKEHNVNRHYNTLHKEKNMTNTEKPPDLQFCVI